MEARTGLVATLALLPLAAAAGDYMGTLKLPKGGVPEPAALYSFTTLSEPLTSASTTLPPERPLPPQRGSSGVVQTVFWPCRACAMKPSILPPLMSAVALLAPCGPP